MVDCPIPSLARVGGTATGRLTALAITNLTTCGIRAELTGPYGRQQLGMAATFEEFHESFVGIAAGFRLNRVVGHDVKIG